MIKRLTVINILLLLFTISSCTTQSGNLLNRVANRPAKISSSYPISSEACGFQLLLVIPININDRMTRAMTELELKAAGAYLTNFQVEETWTYGFVGTTYCTIISAIAERWNKTFCKSVNNKRRNFTSLIIDFFKIYNHNKLTLFFNSI